MLPASKSKTNLGVAVGLVLQIFGNSMRGNADLTGTLGLIIALVGLVVFIWGCMNYAEGKGHSKWYGIIGLLSIIGLIILVLFPDRNKGAV